jgi:ribonuclease J
MKDKKPQKKENLRIIPLGGVGDVTKNLYVYEYGNDILLVDCGIGFPQQGMLGVDLVIPDITYLRQNKEKLRGIVLTHGHEDHVGALPYILPELNIPIYGSRLTIALAEVKLKEANIFYRAHMVDIDKPLKIGVFTVEFIHVTHSIPDATHLVIHTPLGIVYHGSDFKFDWTPVDGNPPDVRKIAQAGGKGILCLLSDCLGSEEPGYTLSEQTIEETLEQDIRNCSGRFIVTTHSSNISRLNQAIKVALRHGRRLCFVGRSMEQNIDVATRLGYTRFPSNAVITPEKIYAYPDQNLCLLVAGSQGQGGSALSRIANNAHKYIKIKSKDTVVFSSDPIPGNENAVHTLIDTLTKQGAKVSYSDIMDDLHTSGHASQQDLMLMMGLVRAKYVLPIGGTYRQMKQYSLLAKTFGYKEENILLVDDGRIIEFDDQSRARADKKIEIKNIFVDGLGVGDVGNIVLRDRKVLSQEGIVIVVVPIEGDTGHLADGTDIISRGFVYPKESGDLFNAAKEVIKASLGSNKRRIVDWQYIRQSIQDCLEKFFYERTERRPMVIPIVVEV